MTLRRDCLECQTDDSPEEHPAAPGAQGQGAFPDVEGSFRDAVADGVTQCIRFAKQARWGGKEPADKNQ